MAEPEHTDRLRYLACLVESAQDIIISAGPDGRIASWNKAAEKLFGYTAAEAVGQPASFLKPPELVGRSGDKVARLRQGETVPAFDTVRRTKDGRDVEVSFTHSPILDDDGEVLGVCLIARDLTQQHAEEAARFHLAAMIEHSGAAIMAGDIDTRVTAWNAAAEKLFGYTLAEVAGRPMAFLIPPERQEEQRARAERLRQGEVIPPYDTVRIHKDGTRVDVSISPSIIRDAAGRIVGFAAFADDITERKQAERDLKAAHEATLIAGREYEAFAYAVAHDLRAPLRGIDGFIHLGQEYYRDGEAGPAQAQLDRARASARQMGRLIDSLLRLAQVNRQLLSRGEVDLSRIAQTAIARLREESPDRVVQAVIRPGLTTIGDGDLLDVVVTNLIDNAWKFTRGRAEARIEFGVEDGHYVVRDNGAGFDMAHSDKLFGLFQRLHHPSEFEGTGIGLATIQRIIRRHGGRIWAEGALDQGATFWFSLPGGVVR